MISSNLALHALSTGKPPRVVTAMTMLKQYLFRYQGTYADRPRTSLRLAATGQIGAALVLGGYDATGPQLFTIAPHGSTDKLPYVTMGSGSLAAMAVFEAKWKPDLTREEGIDLVCESIEAGIFNDLGSGSNVDVAIMEKGKSEMLRNYRRPNEKGVKQSSYLPRKGATAVKKTFVYDIVSSPSVLDGPERPCQVKETIVVPPVATEQPAPMEVD
jgi:20S proteasome subunit beta 2